MSISYHSNCCPGQARELGQLILQAYRLYYDSRAGLATPELLTLETGEYRVEAVFRAKALRLGRYKVFGFIASREDCVYLVFRGTESFSEWIGDGKFIQVRFLDGWGKVHRGFKTIYRSCSTEIVHTLARLSEAGKGRLLIAGHSLGGALSTLACAEAVEKLNFREIAHYTFASPRVGNLVFHEKFQENIPCSFRFLNTEDIVITEPKAATVGTVWQYAHVGIPFAFSHHGGSILQNHLLESYLLYL